MNIQTLFKCNEHEKYRLCFSLYGWYIIKFWCFQIQLNFKLVCNLIKHQSFPITMNASISHEFLPNRPSTFSCIFAAFCCVIFTVVGCVGNWLTIVALTRCRRLRNATTAFVVSLAVADFLFCVFCLPLTATRYIHEEWILGNELCNLFPFFFYGNVAASLMSMTAITFNRYCNHFFRIFIAFIY